MAGDKSIHKIRFYAAVTVMRALSEDGPYQPSEAMMLMFYGYYKQATAGPCNVPKPSFWDSVGKAKWDAWNALGGMPRETAMREYVEEIKQILETIPVTEDVIDLIEVLGDFYECVEDDEMTATAAELTTGIGGKLTPPQSVTETNLSSALMNGKVENSDARVECGEKEEDDDDSDDDDDDEEEEEEESEVDEEDTEDDIEVVVGEKETPSELRVADSSGGLREEALRCNGSAEHTVSSLTHTHSSVNSQEEEEELACTREAPQDRALCQASGHLSDDSEVVTGMKHQANDSDNALSSDSEEELAMEESSGVPRVRLAGTGAARARKRDLRGGKKEIPCESQDGKPQGGVPPTEGLGTVQPDRISSRKGRGCRSLGAGLVTQDGLLSCYGDITCLETERGTEGMVVNKQNMNKQMVMVLTRLQDDMQNVLQRLNILEALTTSQTRSLILRQERLANLGNNKRAWWWPFGLSPITVALAVVWPFMVHWLIQLYLQRRRRRLK